MTVARGYHQLFVEAFNGVAAYYVKRGIAIFLWHNFYRFITKLII